jgi:hypothetical protein
MKTARRDETRERPQWWLIALIAIAAIVVRLIIAYVALPSDAGYTTDLQSFRYWAAELGANGPWGFYGRGFFVDYLPGYLALLWPFGVVTGAVTGATDPGALIKLPAIIADGFLVITTARLASDLGASRRGATVAAAAIALYAALRWLATWAYAQLYVEFEVPENTDEYDWLSEWLSARPEVRRGAERPPRLASAPDARAGATCRAASSRCAGPA